MFSPESEAVWCCVNTAQCRWVPASSMNFRFAVYIFLEVFLFAAQHACAFVSPQRPTPQANAQAACTLCNATQNMCAMVCVIFVDCAVGGFGVSTVVMRPCVNFITHHGSWGCREGRLLMPQRTGHHHGTLAPISNQSKRWSRPDLAAAFMQLTN